jgi:glycine cleavage system protein P-like pyridoxal-binding family
LESQTSTISDIAHENGAECIAGDDPSTLGVLDSPANHGADMLVGTTHPPGLHKTLGIHKGGLGPAADAFGCREELAEYLPKAVIEHDESTNNFYFDYDRPMSGKFESSVGIFSLL